jgi:hypothetical protein
MKSRVAKQILLASILSITSAVAAAQSSEQFNQSFSFSSGVPQGQIVQLPYFNTALGTLTDAYLNISFGGNDAAFYQNEAPVTQIFGGSSFTANVLASPLNGAPIGIGSLINGSNPSGVIVHPSQTIGLNFNFFGPSETSHDTGADWLAYQNAVPNSFNAAVFQVTGSFSSLPGPNFFTVSENYSMGGTLSLTYQYTAANISVVAVPEPEIYAMLLAGLGLLGYIAQQRKQKIRR